MLQGSCGIQGEWGLPTVLQGSHMLVAGIGKILAKVEGFSGLGFQYWG